MKRILITGLLVAGAVAANAGLRSVNLVNPPQNSNGGKINWIKATNDVPSGDFSWTANFSDSPSGKKTQGYWVVVSPGPNPKGHAGELAIFFMDTTKASPILTAYAYNGVNGSNSWQTPGDFIMSSQTGAGVAATKSLTYTNNGDGTRTIGFKVDNTIINSFSPANPGSTPWTGAYFNEKIGIWFHPVTDLKTAYAHDGKLTKWQFGAEGWYDDYNVQTVPEPATMTAMALGLAAIARKRRKS